MFHKTDYLFIYKGDIIKLPPLVTILFTIRQKNKNIVLIIDYLDQKLANDFNQKNIKVIELNLKKCTANSKANKVLYWWNFRKEAKKIMNSISYDTLWFGSADTAINLYGLYSDIKYNINVYELYDTNNIYKLFLRKILPNAKNVIVPEESRASIFKVWFNLKKKPIVLPNKPMIIKDQPNLILDDKTQDILKSDKKIILYQGIIVKGLRDLAPLCKAMISLNDKWQLVLMGPSDPYIGELKKLYSALRPRPYIKPPLHLKVTELVDICVVSYSYKDLNNIFCAPNKIWEYSMFGKPMLCNDVPCLNQTVEKFNAGICIDMDDADAIIDAIARLDKDYTKYSKNASTFYNSVNLVDIIEKIIGEAANE